jgi:hypothetical protein
LSTNSYIAKEREQREKRFVDKEINLLPKELDLGYCPRCLRANCGYGQTYGLEAPDISCYLCLSCYLCHYSPIQSSATWE